MKKERDEDKPLQVNCSLEEPLKGMFLNKCEVDGRTGAGLMKFILKQYFAEQVFEKSNHQPQKDGNLYHYPDEKLEDEAKQKEAD